MLETFVTSEMSATIVTASSSGMRRTIIGHVRCDVRAAANGDHSVSVPSEGKYQPCSAPESPRRCSATTPVNHIAISTAGKAKADLTQRRKLNNTSNAATALPSFAISVVVQGATRVLKWNVRPLVIRMPPATRKHPVAARNPPTTQDGTNRKYDPRRRAPSA